MSYTSYFNNNKKKESQFSLSLFLILAIMAVFMVVAPFYKGLFNGNAPNFEVPIITSFITGAILLMLLSVLTYNNWSNNFITNILLVLIWLIPLCYFISMVGAVSYSSAKFSFHISILYAIFFSCGLQISYKLKNYQYLVNIFFVSGYVLVFIGFLAWFGYITIQDAILNSRLANVFQYPNSYGAYLISLFYVAIHMYLRSKNLIFKNIHLFMSGLIILSILLTYSRGAFIVFVTLMLPILLFYKFKEQLLFVITTIKISIASLILLKIISPIGSLVFNKTITQPYHLGWIYVFIGYCLVIGAMSIIDRLVHKYDNHILKLNNKKYNRLVLPIVFLLISVFIYITLINSSTIQGFLPQVLKERIESINIKENSALARTVFYQDSIKLFTDYPIFGAGGGAWAALYETYQTYPYISRQAHNFFLQFLNEVGITGLFILLVLIGSLIFVTLKRIFKSDDTKLPSLVIVSSILIHSLLDFDLTFVYLGCIVFLFLGTLVHCFNVEKQLNLSKKIKIIYVTSIVLSSVIFFVSSLNMLRSSRLWESASLDLNQQKNVNDIISKLDKSIQSNEYNLTSVLTKISVLKQLYIQTKEENYYNQAMDLINYYDRYEPNNKRIHYEKIGLLYSSNKLMDALNELDKISVFYPWDLEMYENRFVINYELVQKNSGNVSEYYNNIVRLAEEMEKKEQLYLSMGENLPDSKLFGITQKIALISGEAFLSQKKYVDAERILSKYENLPLENDLQVSIIRFYVVALKKLNKDADSYISKLLAKNPNEQNLIDSFMKTY